MIAHRVILPRRTNFSAKRTGLRRLGLADCRSNDVGEAGESETAGWKQGQSRWATAWAGYVAIRASSCWR